MKNKSLSRVSISAIYAAAIALVFSAALSLPAPAQNLEGANESTEGAMPAAGLPAASLIQAFNGLSGSDIGNALNAAMNLPEDFHAQLNSAVAAQDAPKIAELTQVLEQKRQEAVPMVRTLAANDVGYIFHLIETKQVEGKELALYLASAKAELAVIAAFWPEVAPEAKRINALAEQAALADARAQAAALEDGSASGDEAADIGSARPVSFISYLTPGYLLQHHRAKKAFTAAALQIPGVKEVKFAGRGNFYMTLGDDGSIVRTGPPLSVRVAYNADAARIKQKLRALLPKILSGYYLTVEGADSSISAALRILGVLRVERVLGSYEGFYGRQGFSRVNVHIAQDADAQAVREQAADIFKHDDYVSVLHPSPEEIYEAEALQIPGVLKVSFNRKPGPLEDARDARYTAEILIAHDADERAVQEKMSGVLSYLYDTSIRRAPPTRTRFFRSGGFSS